jgi:hypothetical protein
VTAAFSLQRRQPEDHPVSPHALRRHLAGELSADAEKSLLSHVETCDSCQGILADLKADDAAFATLVPFGKFASLLEEKAPQKIGFWERIWGELRPLAMAGIAATAMVAVFVGVNVEEAMHLHPPSIDQVRMKGVGVGLAFVVRESNGIRRGKNGERLGQGDQIQFVVKGTNQTRSLVVLGIDGRGQVTVYAVESFADGMATQTKGMANLTRPLAHSVILDDAVGTERFFAIFSEDGNVEDVRWRAELAAAKLAENAGSLKSTHQLHLEPPENQASVFIEKVAP